MSRRGEAETECPRGATATRSRTRTPDPMRQKPTTSRPARRDSRSRGGAYVAVLAIATVVMVLGLGALLAVRAQRRALTAMDDAADAQAYAVSATELARLELAQNASWRTAYTNDTYLAYTSLGRGSFSWKLVDSDGSLSDDASDAVRVVGIGKAGLATRTYSVVCQAVSTPLPVLGAAAYSALSIAATGTATATGGPFATAGTLTLSRNVTLNANLEVGGFVNQGGTLNGTQTTATAKAMPSAAVFDTYAAQAKTLLFSSLTGNQIYKQVLSKTLNPFGDKVVNAQGVYAVTVPAGSTLTIRSSRLEATLVVTLGAGSTLRTSGPNLWEPPRSDYPALLVKATGAATVDLTGQPGTLDEIGQSTNYNPATSPYKGASDSALDDSYPSELRGVLHIIGAGVQTKISTAVTVRGTVLSEGALTLLGSSTVIADPTLAANPPVGYTQSGTLQTTPGSWRWEAAR